MRLHGRSVADGRFRPSEFHCRLHRCANLVFHPLAVEEVDVDVFCGSRIAVTHDVREVDAAHPPLDHDACEGVAQTRNRADVEQAIWRASRSRMRPSSLVQRLDLARIVPTPLTLR
jgi:hypothetical protein